jgi:hypothetical protein
MRASETGHSLVKASELIGHRRVFRTEDLTEETTIHEHAASSPRHRLIVAGISTATISLSGGCE